MLTMNDVIEMLLNMPKLLAAGWAAWFAFGLVLSIWSRREKLMVDGYASTEHKSGARAAAAKPPSGVRAPKAEPVVASSGDAFGDLEKIFEQEATGTHRTPGERQSPVLAEVTGSNGATLAAPQSLP